MSDPISFTCSRAKRKRRNSLPWRLWRTLSFRRMRHFRSSYRPRDERHSHEYYDDNNRRHVLPDVLEDAACGENSSIKSKGKSLFRSMSLILTKSPTTKPHKRSSLTPQVNIANTRNVGVKSDIDNKSQDKFYGEITQISDDEDLNLVKHSYTMFPDEFYESMTEDRGCETIEAVTIEQCLPPNIRASSPITIIPIDNLDNKRRYPLMDKSITAETFHELILYHVHDLLCCSLTHSSILFTLHSVGLVSGEDYTSTDNPITIDTFLVNLSRASRQKFVVFVEVLRHIDEFEDLSVILSAMMSVCRMIHDIQPDDHGLSVIEDDKKLSFDVGFLDANNDRLMPIMKLRRNQDRRSRKNRKNYFRLSMHSLADDVELSDFASMSLGQKPMISVYISGHNLHNERCKHLASILERFSCILELNICKSQITDGDFETICSALRQNRSICSLDVRLNNISDKGAVKLGAVLRKSCNLKVLNLSSTSIKTVGCRALCNDLSRNAIGNKGIEAICMYLPHLTRLRDLNLENCGLMLSKCDSFCEALSVNESLKGLDLSINHIGDTGIDNLRAIITHASSLNSLALNMCAITTTGFMAVLSALEINKSITLLKLCYNRIGRDNTSHVSPDDVRFRLHCVKSSKPKLKLLLWGNILEETKASPRDDSGSFTSDLAND